MNNLHKCADIPTKDAINEQLERIKHSKVLGRSKINCKLLSFLVSYYLRALENTELAKAPKEFEIATGALNKSDDFDPSEDASIRVYISNLRKKLETYYQTEGKNEVFQITIPTGGYGLEFTCVPKQKAPINDNKNPSRKFYLLVTVVTLSVILNLVFIANYVFKNNPDNGESTSKSNTVSNQSLTFKNAIRQHALWQPLFSNAKPTLIVIGDLFMLTEVDPHTSHLRAVREFGINSNRQFEKYLNKYPEKRTKTYKASSAFLLKNSVFALKHILPLFNDNSSVNIRLASALTATDLREHNIIYIGLYKSLGILDAYLQGSNFQIRTASPALKHKKSAKTYSVTGDLEQEYTDYGSFAQFYGPSGNQFYIFAGFSDASVIQMAKYLTSQTKLSSAEFKQHFQSLGKATSNIELIFSASSFNRTDLDSTLVDSGLLDIKSIWAMPD
ncbi:helix-turn-helix domain-containing protein [Thalassotalea sp. PLHSN55]|uniref:helix-turn-helix domain-containing protein n=1 Tax=Thalassotalea sp. PLHSN55 TaxID=3435888 RepID=UPI003F8406C7